MARGDCQPPLPAHRAAGRRSSGLSRSRTPERLPGIVDAHCHLQDPVFDHDRAEVLARAAAAGVERLLVPGYDLASSRAAVALAEAHPGRLGAAVGIHPHHAASMDEAGWRELEDLAGSPVAVAIGEIGLDFYRNLSSQEAQLDALQRQLALASATGKPVIVHDRDAHAAVTEALLAWEGPGPAGAGPGSTRIRGVLHAFSGDAAMAGEMIGAGFVVSFALPVAFRSAVGPRAAAAVVPAGTFLVETDSPWLAPGGAGERNEPTTVLRVAAELARLRDTTAEEVAAQARTTFDRLLGS